MVIPIGATVSVGAAIYWAAGVFDNTEWVASILTYKFVDIPDVIVVSLDRLLWLLAVGFMFNYLIYVVVNTYVVWKEVKTRSKNHAVSLSMNIIKYVGWGLFVYVAMVTLHVNRAGITLILTGLSTGIGFAMKDTLENLFYGLSLMSGRVKIGDVIECDGVRGRVTNINYQSTLVETIDGSVIAFLNSQLFAKNFKNMTRNHGYEMARLSVGVAYGSHVEQVRKLIIDRLSKLDCYDRKKGINVLFDNFGDSSVDLTVVIWVRVATSVLDQARVKEEIYNALNEAGIEIPFPQADVHVRADAVAAMLAMSCGAAIATDYYVDSEKGDDAADGATMETAWRTLGRVNNAKIAPGDRVLFKRGGLWRGSLRPSSGEEGRPVTYSWYGKGPKPILQQSVDKSRPSDWFEESPGIWSTVIAKPEMLEQIWDGASCEGWNSSWQNGVKGTLERVTEGETFLRATCTAKPISKSNLIQFWGPKFKGLPDGVILRLKVRSSMPFSIRHVEFILPRP
ncbi:MAG: mechanosensitive ion channel family protein, partial [Muribaculaceae bacterium]|nr:mechanosensitive ion channel family protein [Muribaculaceae bacterium]